MKVKLQDGIKIVKNPEYILYKIYGMESQLTKAGEELEELRTEVINLFHNQANYKDLISEITDVEIMIKQLKYIMSDIFNTDIEEINLDIKQERLYKIKRQFNRIYGECNNEK